MLRALAVRDFVIVERADIEFDPGFTVLTGETGAGKSILIDALELLVGGKADGGLVREGADKADLGAEFDLGGAPEAGLDGWLAERDLSGESGVVLIRRTLDRAGRSRCFINGYPATLAQLKEAGELLLDIHGQHAHQSLLRPAAQRALLDAHGGCGTLFGEAAGHFQAWKRLEALASEAAREFSRRQAELGELEEKIAELAKLAAAPDEWESLTAQHTRLAHGASLLEGAQEAVDALTEAEGACVPRLAALASRMRSLSAHDARLNEMADLLESAQAQAAEVARALRHYASRIDLDANVLRDTEARIEALHAAGRKYRRKPQELAALLGELESRKAELRLSSDPVALRREVEAQRARFLDSAGELSRRRTAAAQAMSEAVTAGMQQLAMKGGRFSVELRALEAPAAHGLEEVEFQVSAHPSLPPRPLVKVASGGELSRISLAIQTVASRSSPVGTLVFDEVDSGIGGAVAETVGKSLKHLGKRRQVLCVTHLPQVAAQGDQQWLVAKAPGGSGPGAAVLRLDRAQRVEELARMLGGAQITTTTRKHAAELLGK